MLRKIEEASERIYQVCIIGSGPAGITLAKTLATQGISVALIEGGGLDYSEESQDIYDGDNVGLQYWGLTGCRLRYFGGTSGHWSGRCGLLDSIDFEQREYFGMPGWPISRNELLQYLGEARDILDLGDQSLEPHERMGWTSSLFRESGYALSPPTRFGEKYKDDILKSQNIDLFLNTNLVDIFLDDTRERVVSVKLQRLTGENKFALSAQRFIFALGAIENARILLNSDGQFPRGVGNHADFVGRCFMEHLNVPLGRFLISNADFWHPAIEPRKVGTFPMVPTVELMRKENIGNGIVAFDSDARPRSYGRTRALKQALREAVCSSDRLTNLSRKAIDFDCPGDGVLSTLIEQAPNRNSRLVLSNKRDALGLRRVILDWELNAADKRTIRTLALEAAKEMARLDIARVQLRNFIFDEDMEIEVGGHCHHMGTTRMSANPDYGVVDSNLKVHGIDNLYIAGSSVFPAGGGTNPTLTIVLLSLRLANHLASLN